ncbi:hypothetical protein BO70DRAFT_393211 [Aspergillus heteromorphus CBS 117.55]|uniref:Uncharacterized protein n=1 Tax=Aspergillus heteromorphus CBS 117.55 TaxID=1448321 RepID=A0A317WXH0_9EURO|nr:uncharacterized protein BO70DRAFT_393211 [Aspergillus heteromorphus CBS 117.55]PWY90022.1 hypothetical protein BO70DRAFT_393211 [Aspergillus heteromorphus CBS 117.55]
MASEIEMVLPTAFAYQGQPLSGRERRWIARPVLRSEPFTGCFPRDQVCGACRDPSGSKAFAHRTSVRGQRLGQKGYVPLLQTTQSSSWKCVRRHNRKLSSQHLAQKVLVICRISSSLYVATPQFFSASRQPGPSAVGVDSVTENHYYYITVLWYINLLLPPFLRTQPHGGC